MIEAALLLTSATLFALLFERSRLWSRTKTTAGELRAIVQPFRVSGSGDVAREQAARQASMLLLRYSVVALGALALILLLSSLPLVVAVALGWTGSDRLWTMSLDPFVIAASLLVWLLMARW